MRKYVLNIVVGLVLIGFSNMGFSQVGNFWGESFSTKSALLSGAVVGGYEDEASIYYNPSILSDSSVNQFAFANGLVTLDAIQYENALGDGLEAGNWESSVDPGFISVNLYPKKKLDLVWKAAFFNKTKYDNGLSSAVNETYDVFPGIDGQEDYLGQVKSRIEFNDYWYGVAIAKRLSDKFSVGLSMFARYSSIRYESTKSINVTWQDSLQNIGKVAVSDKILNVRGYSWRGAFKIGVNYKLNEVVRLGITVTPPSFTMVSSTTVNKKNINVNIPSSTDSTNLHDYVYNEFSENLNLRIKDPLSIAAGVDFKSNKFRWNFTVEWFAAVGAFRVIDQSVGDVETTLSDGFTKDPDNLSFVGGGTNIINFAIGMEKFTSTGRSWLFGFKTDFNAQKNMDFGSLNGLNELGSARSDYFHFSAGKNFQFLNFDVLFGVQYSISRAKGLPSFANFMPPIAVDPSNPYSLEGPQNNNMNFKGDALTIFVGLTLKKQK